MDYPCAKFGDFSFSPFGFIVQTDRHTESQTDRITDTDDCYTDATTVSISNYTNMPLSHLTLLPNLLCVQVQRLIYSCTMLNLDWPLEALQIST